MGWSKVINGAEDLHSNDAGVHIIAICISGREICKSHTMLNGHARDAAKVREVALIGRLTKARW